MIIASSSFCNGGRTSINDDANEVDNETTSACLNIEDNTAKNEDELMSQPSKYLHGISSAEIFYAQMNGETVSTTTGTLEKTAATPTRNRTRIRRRNSISKTENGGSPGRPSRRRSSNSIGSIKRVSLSDERCLSGESVHGTASKRHSKCKRRSSDKKNRKLSTSKPSLEIELQGEDPFGVYPTTANAGWGDYATANGGIDDEDAITGTTTTMPTSPLAASSPLPRIISPDDTKKILAEKVFPGSKSTSTNMVTRTATTIAKSATNKSPTSLRSVKSALSSKLFNVQSDVSLDKTSTHSRSGLGASKSKRRGSFGSLSNLAAKTKAGSSRASRESRKSSSSINASKASSSMDLILACQSTATNTCSSTSRGSSGKAKRRGSFGALASTAASKKSSNVLSADVESGNTNNSSFHSRSSMKDVIKSKRRGGFGSLVSLASSKRTSSEDSLKNSISSTRRSSGSKSLFSKSRKSSSSLSNSTAPTESATSSCTTICNAEFVPNSSLPPKSPGRRSASLRTSEAGTTDVRSQILSPLYRSPISGKTMQNKVLDVLDSPVFAGDTSFRVLQHSYHHTPPALRSSTSTRTKNLPATLPLNDL